MASIDEIAASLDSQNQTQLEAQQEAAEAQAAKEANQRIVDTINQAVSTLVAAEREHETVSVDNLKYPTSIKTPDVQRVVDALENLKQPLQENKPDDTKIIAALTQLNESISKLPTQYPEIPEPVEVVTVKNQPDYSSDFKKLSEAIKSIDTKPEVTVQQEKINLDLKPILASLDSVISAVSKIPTPAKVDFKPMTAAIKEVQDAITALRFPVPNYVLPFRNSAGKAVQVSLDSAGNLPIAGEALSGAGTDTTLTLTAAATSYQVPASPPASAYLLLLYNGSDTDMFITFTSSTTGGVKLAAGANLNIDLGASQSLFAYSSGTGKVLNVSYKVI